MTTLATHAHIVRGRMHMALIYRSNSLFFLVLVLIQIFILRKVWTSLYADQSSVEGFDRSALLVYLTIANLQAWLFNTRTVMYYMYERVREGLVAFDIMRPVGFVGQMLAHLVGSSAGYLAFMLPALPVLWAIGWLGGPASLSAGLLYVVSFVLGYAVAMLLTVCIGMISFWTIETEGMGLLYQLVSQFFAGALVPLVMFPAGLRILAEALPFQATAYTPVAIYVGTMHGGAAVAALGVQVAWVAALAVVVHLMWKRALYRVVVQGG